MHQLAYVLRNDHKEEGIIKKGAKLGCAIPANGSSKKL